MKIGLVTPFYFPTVGGISVFAFNLASALAFLGHNVDIITPQTNGQVVQNLSDNLRVVFLPGGRISMRRKVDILRNLNFRNFCLLYTNNNFFVEVTQWFLEHRYDVIHTNDFLFLALPSTFQKESIHVHTFHSHPWKPAKLSTRILYRHLVKFIDHITCVSKDLPIEISSNLGVHSYEIVNNGIDLNLFKPALRNETNKEVVVGSVTNFVIKEKALGLKMFIDVIKTLESENLYPTVFKVVIVGTGKFRKEIIEYADKIGVKGIAFKAATYEEMPSIYNEFDIYVHASGIKGIPLAVLEAIACGKPVVANANFVDLVSSKAVHVTKSKEDMVDALRSLITDTEKRKEKGILAREEANRYSWENVAKSYLRLYNTPSRDLI